MLMQEVLTDEKLDYLGELYQKHKEGALVMLARNIIPKKVYSTFQDFVASKLERIIGWVKEDK